MVEEGSVEWEAEEWESVDRSVPWQARQQVDEKKGYLKICSWVGVDELWMVELGVENGKMGFPTVRVSICQNRSGRVAKWRKNKSSLIVEALS